jgi:hypothetical protein
VLAVMNKTRSPAAPHVPTAAEAGYPQLSFDGVTGFFGGRDMPVALRDRIAADVRAVADSPHRTRPPPVRRAANGVPGPEAERDAQSPRARLACRPVPPPIAIAYRIQ